MKKQFYNVEFKEEAQEKNRRLSFFSNAYEFVSTVIMALLIVAVVFTFVFRIATVEGSYMNPTLENSDKIIITNLTSNYKVGDIIVIHRTSDVPLIKRIIAKEGDTVDIDFKKGQVKINGKVIEEDYIAEPTHLDFEDGFDYPVKVPKGHVFVMGDNRNASLDSRCGQVGFIDVNSIVGKAVLTGDK